MTQADPYDEYRDALWRAAKPLIPELGWSVTMMEKAVSDAGLDEGLLILALPNGAADLLTYASQESDAALLEALGSMDLSHMRIRDKITKAVRMRIEGMGDHRDVVKRSMAFLSLPQNAVLGTTLLYNTVDTIWHGIGDTSVDFNFYTKRATLAGVYSSTVLYWFSDESEDYADTWAFLDRRIENVMDFEKFKGQMRKMMDQIPSPFTMPRS